MTERKKTNIDLVLDVLRSGQSLKLSEIAAYIGEISGKKVKQTDISSLLSKLCNSEKSEIGNLIERRKEEDGRYAYNLVGEALLLTPEETYDLARKTGKNRFSLQDAAEKYPDLKKYLSDSGNLTIKRKAREKKNSPAMEAANLLLNAADDPDLMRMVSKAVKNGLNIKVNINICFEADE